MVLGELSLRKEQIQHLQNCMWLQVFEYLSFSVPRSSYKLPLLVWF